MYKRQVSYNEKHNDANGEGNRDGESFNRSWNCGAEGPTTDPDILKLRGRQQRNLLATLLLSQGVPMLAHGDELGRTQHGNNNGYCQDNELTWVDWEPDEERSALLAFTQTLLQLRSEHPVLRRRRFFAAVVGGAGEEPTPPTTAASPTCATSHGSHRRARTCRTPPGTWTRPAP